MNKLAFSVLNKYLLTINYVLYNSIQKLQRIPNNQSIFSAGRFLKRNSFLYSLLILLPLLYSILETQSMNTF